jgi:hypothetical protein
VTFSNPAATGSAGPAFETKVAAACLTLLLTRGAPLCLGAGTLRSVHLQAGHLGLGWRTDDLLLEATSAAGESMKAALQVKRTFSLSAMDSECVQFLRGALGDFRNSAQFDQQRDVVTLVTSSLSAKLARGLRTLLDCARASITAADMARRLAIPGYLGKPALGYHKTIGEILAAAEGGAPSVEELWQFLRRFHIVDLDLNVASGFTETMLRSLLAATLPDGDASAVDVTWNELVTLALCDAGRAMSYTRETLPPALLQRHGRATGFSHGVSQLLEDSAVVADSIRTTIAEKTAIPRRELSGELCQLIETSPLVFVTGVAGSGKSALVKSAFAIATQGGIGFAFRAVSLAGHHINDVLHRFGLSLAELQAQTAMHSKKVLWVDSLERLMEKPAEQRAAFLDLLRALKLDPTWRLVVTCRDYSAETVRTAFFSEVGLTPTDIDVGELSDDELDDVVTDFPPLERPLSNPTLRSLLRNPFFLDKAAKMNWLVTEPLPTTERAFREKVWSEVARRVDEEAESGLPNLRGQVMVEVALRRAKALEPYVAASDLDSRALARLVRDSLLQTPSPGSDLYAPAHDVFEDWALMRWLDQAFVYHERQLDSLLVELGTYPALRRAYRRWLTESLDVDPQTTDSLVVALVRNRTVAAHWREDTLVGVLQSRDARGFMDRNIPLLLDDDAALLREVVHILRVACRAAIPRRFFGVDSVGEFFLPKGNGWIGAGQLMEEAIPHFTEADLLLIVGFLEDWVLLTKYGLLYPPGASSIAKVAWHWVSRIPWRSGVRDAEERLLRVILAIPAAAEPKLSQTVEAVLAEGRQNRFDDDLLKLLFSHFACDAVVRDLPDLAFRVAEQLLGLNRSLAEVVGDHSGYDMEAVNYAFGLGTRFSMDDYPPSAYNGPFLRMLWHHPMRGVDFIVRLINRACDAYAHPDNRYEYIEQPGSVTLQLSDGPHEQHANWRLWSAYRGMHVAPHCFESALMALEYWLLEKAKRGDADLDSVLLDLLHRSNNVAVTAVVASIAAAYPGKTGEAGYCLLTCSPLLSLDLTRSSQEAFLPSQLGGFGIPQISAEKGLYDKERKESARLKHRGRNLEYVAAILQMLEGFRERVWALIDAYKAELPPETEQDEETKLWRLQLHRLDTRNLVRAGRTEEGHIIFQSKEPEPDLQALVNEQKPRSAAFNSAISLLNWGRSAFEGKMVSDDWRDQISRAQAHIATIAVDEGERDLGAAGPAYVAAVCIRDHWPEMSAEEQEWCAQTVCDAVDADADVADYLSIVARNPTEGSRAGAFAMTALFDKALSPATQARLLPILSRAVMHAVEETVSYAVQGIARFLWKSDRPLALTCLQALVTRALEHHALMERRRRRPLFEQVSDDGSGDTFKNDLRLRMREFVINRGPGDEAQIATLDLARWPGRAVASHLFAIAAQNPVDPLARQVMQQCATTLPTIWEANERRRSMSHRDEERYDPQIEHDFVDALCRFVIQLEPNDARQFLDPIFLAAPRFLEKAASIITWLILYQGDRAPALTLWQLWQRFADDFAANADAEKVDEEHSDEAKMLRELFLGVNWAEQRDWLPLHGETQRLRAFFLHLPPMEQGFECYAYYLAKAGTPTLPDSLIDVATKLAESSRPALLNENAIFYLEEIMTRLIYGGNTRIRIENDLRQATLRILDALVDAGSSPAYKLRDDFLTPSAG